MSKIPLAKLETISFEKLETNDPETCERLLNACQSPGFFYIAFDDENRAKTFRRELDVLYAASFAYFSQPDSDKMVDGCYQCGPGHESYEVARDKINTTVFPPMLHKHVDSVRGFSALCSHISQSCLRVLSDSLGLEKGSSLEASHQENCPSDTGLKFISGPSEANMSDVKDTTHTDGGTLTLLCCDKWANQLQNPETKEWEWIEPTRGRILCNVADFLQQQTSGKLHSCLHRVTQPAAGVEDRLFVSFLLRPAKCQ